METVVRTGGGVTYNQNYTTDLSGQVLERSMREGSSGPKNAAAYYRFGGRAMGEVGNDGTAQVDYATAIDRRGDDLGTGPFMGGASTGTAHADFDINHVTLASTADTTGGAGYTAQGGESLEQVAQAIWGDSSLWYQLAEANGLSAGSILAAGQVVQIPNGALSATHNASSVQPYDPARALGDIGPVTPQPPRADKGCGVVGQILTLVVAVAVTAILTPAGATLGQTVLGAVGGNIASQGVGIATGVQKKFSFKGVALSALSAGVNAGLGELTKAGGAAGKVGAFLNKGTIGSDLIRGAAASAITQGIGTATGLQSSFSWAGVAAAGVSAAVGGALGRGLASENGLLGIKASAGSFGAQLATATAGGIANAATRSAINGNSFGKNLQAAIPDIIGQAVGGAIGNALRGDGRTSKTASSGPENLLAGTGYDTIADSANAVFWSKPDTTGEKLAAILGLPPVNAAESYLLRRPGPIRLAGVGDTPADLIWEKVSTPEESAEFIAEYRAEIKRRGYRDGDFENLVDARTADYKLRLTNNLIELSDLNAGVVNWLSNTIDEELPIVGDAIETAAYWATVVEDGPGPAPDRSWLDLLMPTQALEEIATHRLLTEIHQQYQKRYTRHVRNTAPRVLEESQGPRPANMQGAHAHHIVYFRGKGAEQQALAIEGQHILQAYDIDPFLGPENLVWAPASNQHTTANLEMVVGELRLAYDAGRPKSTIVQVLRDQGEIANERRR